MQFYVIDNFKTLDFYSYIKHLFLMPAMINSNIILYILSYMTTFSEKL